MISKKGNDTNSDRLFIDVVSKIVALRFSRPLWLVGLCSLLFSGSLVVSQPPAASNVTSDGTVGTTVTQSGNVLAITDGTRPGGGENLFHSFGQFSIDAGDIASFNNNSGLPTTNILSRVTGGTSSNINGMIRTINFPNANLFLINPAGMVFGPNATLNVNGSFHASTADYILMSDGGRFGADITNPANTILTVANPTSFGFLDASVATIELSSGASLNVDAEQVLSLVGGNIMLNGATIAAPSGGINLASVASSGEVTPFEASAIGMNGFTTLGDINITSSSLNADTSGFSLPGYINAVASDFKLEGGSVISVNSQTTESAGNISITADNNIDVGVGSRIEANAASSFAGGIDISAGNTLDVSGTVEAINARDPFGLGTKNFKISAATVNVNQGGSISAVTEGVAPAGHIEFIDVGFNQHRHHTDTR